MMEIIIQVGRRKCRQAIPTHFRRIVWPFARRLYSVKNVAVPLALPAAEGSGARRLVSRQQKSDTGSV